MKATVDIILLIFRHPFANTGEKDQEQGSISLQHLTATDHKTMITKLINDVEQMSPIRDW